MTDQERDARSGSQWLRSVQSYLEFMSGSTWRRYHDRQSDEYGWYLQGLRTLNGISVAIWAPRAAQSIPQKTVEDIALASLASNSRARLVDELLALNPSLTNQKILLHLGNLKLARMLTEARAAVAAAEPLRRSA
jgi:hypothetical protein